MADLIEAWLNAPSVDSVHLDRHGVSFKAAAKCGGVRQGKDGFWVLAAYADPPSIFRMVDEPVLLDFVTFDPDAPECWQTVYGEGVMLGEAAFEEARFHKLPLPVFKNPLHWLQAAGAGVFPLDADAFAREALMYPPVELAAEDFDHARALDRLIERAIRAPKPKITVPV